MVGTLLYVGIAGVQFRLPAVWKEASARGFSLPQLSKWLAAGPADFMGVGETKVSKTNEY